MSEQSPAVTALLSYSQADMDGIIVTVSRQAIHEVVDELTALRTRAETAEARVGELEAALMRHADQHDMISKIARNAEAGAPVERFDPDAGKFKRVKLATLVAIEAEAAAEHARRALKNEGER
jgi:uncharacterized protein YigA (DUF484 family)